MEEQLQKNVLDSLERLVGVVLDIRKKVESVEKQQIELTNYVKKISTKGNDSAQVI